MVNSSSDFDTAVAAYRDYCTSQSMQFLQPIEEYSRQINNVIYLRTSAIGYVARFDIRRYRLLV